MTTLLIWIASGSLVGAMGIRSRPRLGAGSRRAASSVAVSSVIGAVTALGAWVRRRLPDRWLGDPTLPPGDMALGITTVVALLALVPAPMISLVCPIAVLMRRVWTRRTRRRRREDAVTRGLPDVVDRLGLAVRGGLTLRQALEAGQPYAPEPFHTQFATALARHQNGEAWADALRHAAVGLGSSARSVLTLLVAAERDGAPLAEALARAGDEARRRRRTYAEQRARRLPVVMLFPLVFFILPAFGLLTIAPVLYATLRDLEFPI